MQINYFIQQFNILNVRYFQNNVYQVHKLTESANSRQARTHIPHQCTNQHNCSSKASSEEGWRTTSAQRCIQKH